MSPFPPATAPPPAFPRPSVARRCDRWLPWAFLALGAAVVAAQQLAGASSLRPALFAACRWAATAAIVVGVVRHRPERRAPWVLLAVGAGWAAVGNSLWAVLGAAGGQGTASIPPLFYGPAYVPAVVGLAMLDRRRRIDQDVALDGAIIAFASLAVLWTLVLVPRLSASQPWSQTMFSLVPVVDLTLLALLVHRMVVRRAAPVRSLDLLALALGSLLLGDVAFLVATQGGAVDVASPFDLCWLAAIVLMGTAALHPSMADVSGPLAAEARQRPFAPDEGPARFGVLRVIALGVALAAPVTVALVRGIDVRNATILAVTSSELVLITLVTVRLGRLVAVVRRKLREAHELQATMAHQATHDTLTGLPNRQLFAEELRGALSRRSDEASVVAVLFIDVDHLKAVNDTLGHDAGDRVLKAVGRRIGTAVRSGDVVARFGGDEFVVLLAPLASAAEGRAVAERVAEQVRTPVVVNGEPVVVTATIGMTASAPDDALATPEGLLHDADAALLDGKRRGRDLVVPFEAPMRAHLMGWLQTENELRTALAHGELRLHYQPEVDLASRRLFGVEALIRWQHPERGLVPPAQFLGVAESSGLIMPIGRWVIEEACRQARHWRSLLGADAPCVSVNVSPLQLARDDVAGQVARALRLNRLGPEALRVEVTETALLADEVHAGAQVRALRAMGVEVAVDDFGTGFFSLSHLKDLRVDVIKIDRSFVAGVGSNGIDDAIIHSVIELARRLGVRTVAEGVETAAQLRHLLDAGCDVAQGFYYARPLPPAELEARLVDGTFRRAAVPPGSAAGTGDDVWITRR